MSKHSAIESASAWSACKHDLTTRDIARFSRDRDKSRAWDRDFIPVTDKTE